MKKLKFHDPYDSEEMAECVFHPPQAVKNGISDARAVELWNSVMRKITDKDGNVVLKPADSAPQVFARKIDFFMNDPEHIEKKFGGIKPRAKDIYAAAKFSKSKWGRIMSGELSDIERGNAFAMAVALRLDRHQTAELLFSAGFALNYELDLDAAMMYFINRELYDLDFIYSVLSSFSNVENGLDCFVFQPVSKAQMPKSAEEKIKK